MYATCMLHGCCMNFTWRLQLFWRLFGRGYLVQSHEYMQLNNKLGCKALRMESFATNFDGELRALLTAWHIKHEVKFTLCSCTTMLRASYTRTRTKLCQ